MSETNAREGRKPSFPNQPPRYVDRRRTRRRRSDVVQEPVKPSDDELDEGFPAALREDSEDER